MRRILCVAEKNDVAKGVANILGRANVNRRDGRSKYNKIYQFQIDVLGQPSLITMTSVSGHLMNFEFGPEMRDWTSVPMRSLFDATLYLKVIPNMENIARTLKEEAQKADALIIFTDCDREGEAIGAEVVTTCMETNRRLDVYRAKFSEITPRAINNAINNLVRLDSKIVDAVFCRSELDLRIGAAFTRLQTLHLRQQFQSFLNAAESKVISYGSCQFPTLGFVVERYKAIENFVTETFWKIACEHTRNGTKVDFNWERQRLFDRQAVVCLFEDCLDAKAARIIKITGKAKSKWRPQALDTVEFEKLCVRKLKMTAKTAMAVAEKLYTKGYISYPRTETNKFPPDIRLEQLTSDQSVSTDWGNFADQVLSRGANPRNGSKSDEAHPPIHPLKYAQRHELDANEWRVYELIVRHFLACISWDAKGQETKVELQCEEEHFTATGLQIEDLGYMNVYPYEKWSDKTLPLYREGEVLHDHKLKIVDGHTQPPPLLNEADLISLMDKYGIGTDATHSEHIEKIKERLYVGVNNDGRFVPGFLGLALVDGYDDMGYAMSKPHLRADLERELKAICSGARTKQQVLEEQKEKYRRIFEQTELQINKLSRAFAKYVQNNPNVPLLPPNVAPAAPPPTGRGGRGGRQGNPAPTPNRVDSDDIPPSARGRRRGRPRGTTQQVRGHRGGRGGADVPADGNQDAGKPCQCGIPATMRTVRKEGANHGKKFLCCSKEMGEASRCNFFEWV